MTKKLILFILIFIIFSTNLFAKGILLSVDDINLVVGQTTTLQVTLSNLKSDSIPTIQNISTFNINFTGTSSNISIINGVFKSEKVYTFIITPKKSGEFVIGPAILKIGNKIYKSNVVKIKVLQALPKQKKQNENIFLSISCDKKEAKLNEQILLKVKIFRRINVVNMSLKIPSINEFIVYKLNKGKEYEEIKEGKKFYVTEFLYSLFPTETGILTIDPFILEGDIVISNNPLGQFFSNPFVIGQTKHISIPSNSLSIKVTPLDQGVYAVGNFNCSYGISKSSIKVGDSVTLTLKISGFGNLNLSDSLHLPTIHGLKYYPDKPIIKLQKTSQGIYSEKVEKIAIIPEKPGLFQIPELKLNIYNCNKNNYEYITLPSINLKVMPKENDNLTVVESKNKEIIHKKEDISTIKTYFPLKNQNIILSVKEAILFSIPILIYFVILCLKIIYLKKKANYKTFLRENAFSNFKKELNNVTSIDDLSNAIKKYFSLKLEKEIENLSLTFSEIIKMLESQKCNLTIINKLKNLFNELEKIQFAGIGLGSIEDYKKRSFELIKEIEKII